MGVLIFVHGSFSKLPIKRTNETFQDNKDLTRNLPLNVHNVGDKVSVTDKVKVMIMVIVNDVLGLVVIMVVVAYVVILAEQRQRADYVRIASHQQAVSCIDTDLETGIKDAVV